jgi:hypothetical protein
MSVTGHVHHEHIVRTGPLNPKLPPLQTHSHATGAGRQASCLLPRLLCLRREYIRPRWRGILAFGAAGFRAQAAYRPLTQPSVSPVFTPLAAMVTAALAKIERCLADRDLVISRTSITFIQEIV